MKAWTLLRSHGSTILIPEKGRLHSSLFRTLCVLGALILLPASSLTSVRAQGVQTPPVPEEGLWLSQDHDGVFLIGHCGDTLCGKLIGMQYDGPVPKDVWGRSQCGLVMLTGFRLSKDENAWQGHILDPETGRTYDARIHAESSDVLKLRGFILGIPLFGKTQTWTRYRGTIGPECKLP